MSALAHLSTPVMTEEDKIAASSARKRRAAFASTGASAGPTLAKLVAGALWGSSALLSEAPIC
jgi:divalent metal cation (Fe/Co/Zn/Cd) transporter